MQLTVAPNQFFWPKETQIAFYDQIAQTPVDRVVLGELVCSKRLPFYQDMLPETIDKLTAAGKQVALTSLALITLKRERKLTAGLVEMGCEVEINDLSVLPHLEKGTPFAVGPPASACRRNYRSPQSKSFARTPLPSASPSKSGAMAACRSPSLAAAITPVCTAAPRTIANLPARMIPTGWMYRPWTASRSSP